MPSSRSSTRVAPLQIALQDDFGVAVGAEFRAARFEFAAQLSEIVDFAVENDGAAAGLVGHRLIGAVTRIHDRKAAEYQGPAGLGRASAGIRPAMKQVAVGAVEEFLAEAPARFKEGGKSTHRIILSAKGMLRLHGLRIHRHQLGAPCEQGRDRRIAESRIGRMKLPVDFRREFVIFRRINRQPPIATIRRSDEDDVRRSAPLARG